MSTAWAVGVRGGKYGGCCRTFVSVAAFDAHRVGPFTDRRCHDATSDPRWVETDEGWRRLPKEAAS